MTDHTLTCRASGPAEATTEADHDGVAIATTTAHELTATLDVDAAFLAAHGYVSKRSPADLPAANVAEVVCETRSDEATTFEPDEGWTLELSGSFEAWAEVALAVADDLIVVRSDRKRANAMCHVLDGLAEHAVDERPRLVMLDVLGSYDPADYSREKILSELSVPAEPTPEATPATEATADD